MAGLANEVRLARRVDGQYLGPYGDQEWTQLAGRRLQQPQDVGKDPHRKGQVYCPRAQVQKLTKQVKGLQSVSLAE